MVSDLHAGDELPRLYEAMYDLRQENEKLRAKLAAAESACREALGEPSAHGLADWGWLVAINAREGNIPEQRRCEKKRDEIHAKLRAVLAGEGEATFKATLDDMAAKSAQAEREVDKLDAARAPGREGGE